MNRIDQKFKELKARRKKAFIPFVTAGDPDLKTTAELVCALEAAGADIIEIGIPFSDPMADGKTIQAASQRSLKKGATLKKIFETVERIRQRSQVPLLFMTYYNPVFHYGDEAFVKKCAQVGVDGLIIPDLPPEEAGALRKAAAKYHIAVVFFVAPTTTNERIKANAKASTGFIYYVALAGVTGTKAAVAKEVVKGIRRIKRYTNKPVCAGFGISTPQQARDIAKTADGVIVASAIIKEIAKHRSKTGLVKHISAFVTPLARALK